jgi:A/G-specific adenine glycosylase
VISKLIVFFQEHLLSWYKDHGRHDLPWQHQSPYHIWISEIMLQQTQVTTVIPYYERFITRFPDIASLAAAHEDEVCQLWSGLGYYHRARNIHRTAQILQQDYYGQVPNELSTLKTLPGIGPSVF